VVRAKWDISSSFDPETEKNLQFTRSNKPPRTTSPAASAELVVAWDVYSYGHNLGARIYGHNLWHNLWPQFQTLAIQLVGTFLFRSQEAGLMARLFG